MYREVATTSPSRDRMTACRTCSTRPTRLSSGPLSCPAVPASAITKPHRCLNPGSHGQAAGPLARVVVGVIEVIHPPTLPPLLQRENRFRVSSGERASTGGSVMRPAAGPPGPVVAELGGNAGLADPPRQSPVGSLGRGRLPPGQVRARRGRGLRRPRLRRVPRSARRAGRPRPFRQPGPQAIVRGGGQAVVVRARHGPVLRGNGTRPVPSRQAERGSPLPVREQAGAIAGEIDRAGRIRGEKSRGRPGQGWLPGPAGGAATSSRPPAR